MERRGKLSPDGTGIRQLPDGTICIGSECAEIRIPPKGDVEIDLTRCSTEVKNAVLKKFADGPVRTGYKTHGGEEDVKK